MSWEEIHQRAMRIVGRIFTAVTDTEKTEDVHRGSSGEEDDLWVEEFLETDQLQQEYEHRKTYDYHRAFRRIRQEKRTKMLRRIGTIAACLTLMVGGAGIYSVMRSDRATTERSGSVPASRQVILVMSNGKQVVLDGKDSLRLEEGDKTVRIRNGRIAYQAERNVREEAEMRYNTLAVPRGAEYRIELADGTRVHLNAESELVYPVAFTGDRREVKLRGEAWFEVAKDSLHPFYVKAEEVQIRVYGTAFNVNTHPDRRVQTVLVEGSVGIRAGRAHKEVRMQPGQLAEYDREQGQIRLKEVDSRQYTAWREGIFYFNDETLEEILYELSRWYDMEVFFRSNEAKGLHFSGHLARYEDIRKILDTVTESTGVTFDINEKTIIVK